MTTIERILLHASALAAAGTGGVCLWMKYLVTSNDPFSVVHHPRQPQVLALHVLVVPFVVFALGLIAREHVVERFLDRRPHRSRRSGIAAILLAPVMIASGYLMQVLTGPGPRNILAMVHEATGAAFALLYVVHLALSCPAGGAAGARSGPKPRRRARASPGPRLDWFKGLGLESVFRSFMRAPAVEPPAGPSGRRS